METREIIWTPAVKEKLTKFRSDKFTPEETLNYIIKIVKETEDFLSNPIIGKTYTEDFGKYKGISRTVIRKFRVYYKKINDDIVIIGLLFPGEG